MILDIFNCVMQTNDGGLGKQLTTIEKHFQRSAITSIIHPSNLRTFLQVNSISQLQMAI